MATNKKYKIGLVIEGDGRGGVKAIQANEKAFKKYTAGSKKAAQSNKSFTSSAKGMITKAGALGAAAGAAAALVGTLAAAIKTEAIHELNVLSKTLDVSVSSLSTWGYAAESLGLSSEKMGDIFKDTSDKIGDFIATGGGEAKDLFDNLGLSVENLKDLSPDEQLLAIADGLDQVGTNGEKIFYLESLADEASKLLPLLEDGASELRKLQREAELLGVALDDVDAAQVEQAAAAFRVLGGAADGFSKQLTVKLSGAFAMLDDYVLDFLADFGGMEGLVDKMVDSGVRGIAQLLDAFNSLRVILKTSEFGWLSLGQVAIDMMASSADAVARLVNYALEPLSKMVATIADGWGKLFYVMGDFLGETGDGLRDIGGELADFAAAAQDFKIDADDIRKAQEGIGSAAALAAEELEELRKAKPGEDFVRAVEEHQKAAENQARATVKAAKAQKELEKETAKTTATVKKQKEQADEYAKSWEKAVERIDESFANGWLDILQGNASDVFDNILGGFQQMLAEMLHLAITKPITLNIQQAISGTGGGGFGSLFGGGGAGGGGGGLLSSLSSLYNIASGGVGAGIMGAGTTLASLGGSLGLTSLGSFGGGLASAGGLISTGGLWGGSMQALGHAGTLFSSGSIAGGLGAALPVIGMAAALAGIVDKISGGGLFGTDWKTKDTGVELEYSGGDFNGRAYEYQKKKKSFFRGTKRRDVYTDLDDALVAQMDNYFDNVENLIVNSADTLGIETVKTTQAAFGDVLDLWGSIPQQFTTTAEQSVADYLANYSTSERISLKDLDEEQQAAAIQDWTTGISNDLVSTVFGDALDGLGREGETLIDTLGRVVAQLELTSSAFDTVGISLEDLAAKAGVQALNYSDDVIQAAGGGDRLAQLIASYQQAYFSEAEILTQALEGMAGQLASSLDGLEYSFGSDFRAAFETAQSGGLAADELVRWLEAGGLVAQFNQLAEQLAAASGGDAAELAAEIFAKAQATANGEAGGVDLDSPEADPVVAGVTALNETLTTTLGTSNDSLASIDNHLEGMAKSLEANLRAVANENAQANAKTSEAVAQLARQVSAVSSDVRNVAIDSAAAVRDAARLAVNQASGASSPSMSTSML